MLMQLCKHRKRSGRTLPRPPSRTTWRRIDGADGFPELVASFVLWQKNPHSGEREGGESERPVFALHRGDQALTKGGDKVNARGGYLRRVRTGGSASAISASSPQPALKEKCLAADRRVHSPRVVAARILSGILMASGFSSIQGPALSMHPKI